MNMKQDISSSEIPVTITRKWLSNLCREYILKDCLKNGLGLYDGKMGYVLFFFHSARYLNNLWFEEYAEELLDEIYCDITLETPINFFNGLCGIGWGIEYLVQHGFVRGCTDEILADLDEMVMRTDPRRIEDSSYETGIRGIAAYVCSRLSSPRSPDSTLPFDSLYLDELKGTCLRLGVDMEYDIELSDLLERVNTYYSGKPKSEMCWYLVLKQLYVLLYKETCV